VILLVLALVLQEPTIADARRALDGHEYERAAALAQQATDDAPDDAEAWLVLGLARFRGGKPEEARLAFERAATLAPESALAQFNLGSAAYETSHFDQAETAWLEAARRSDKLLPLATERAGMAAEEAGRFEAAEKHYAEAETAARAAHEIPLAEDAADRLRELRDRGTRKAREAVRTLAHAGKEALSAGRADEAVLRYREASDLARRSAIPDADRAEVAYGLGHALLRKGDADSSAAALAEATRLAPREADFWFMLGVAEYDRGLASDDTAHLAFDRALALGLPPADADRARRYLGAIAARADEREGAVLLDARAAAGYDSNVPQSGIIVTEPQVRAGEADPAAPSLAADFDALWRAAGTAQNGIALEYRFSQLAYLSNALDAFSLQEHDVAFAGAVTPEPWLTLELDTGGFVLFSGIQTFTPFQAGVVIGPRVTAREGGGFETRVRWEHTFKRALETGFESLTGSHDDLGVQEIWRRGRWRLAAGWLLRREAVDQQRVPISELTFPQGLPSSLASDGYVIPYSYASNEGSLAASSWIGAWLRLAVSGRYEHRDYTKESFIVEPVTMTRSYPRKRVDDRFAIGVGIAHPIDERFDLELAYELTINRSNIDNTNLETPLDYDDKNYDKHTVEVGVVWRY
jgi:tetratricopeptide (TPR) repeat protein